MTTDNECAAMAAKILAGKIDHAIDKLRVKKDIEELIEEENLLPGDYSNYADFNVPWDFGFDYSFNYRGPTTKGGKSSINARKTTSRSSSTSVCAT